MWCGLCFGKPHELRFDLTTKQDVINDDNKTTTNNFLILNNIFNKYLNIEVFINKKELWHNQSNTMQVQKQLDAV